MKVVIFAGGFGTRLSEETTVRPKPMAEIGNKPMLWHIMKIYSFYGHNEFIILGGYKVDYIRDYFLNFRARTSNFTIDLATNHLDWLEVKAEKWRVTVLDTGVDTLTAGRLKRARDHLDEDAFLLTYGDGVADIDIDKLVEYHRSQKKLCTLTAVVQPGRFGALHLSEDGQQVLGFREKGKADGGRINAGFFVCEPRVIDLIDHDFQMWEDEPMERLVESGQLSSYIHSGYWESMDTLRDKLTLEKKWAKGAPWKIWKD